MSTPLRQIRLKNNYSLAEVAAAVGSDAGNLSRIEKGNQKPSLQLATDLSKFFNEEISELELLYPERYVTEGYFEDLTQEENAE
ncbi:TPA: helix-turn-helix transcriptional regulator [Acinetobacter baumannii]